MKQEKVKQDKPSQHRLFVDIPHSTLRKLLLWSASRGETKNGWARTIIVLRCEENSPKVDAWLEKEASQLGVEKKVLENRILNKMGFDEAAYKQEMLNE